MRLGWGRRGPEAIGRRSTDGHRVARASQTDAGPNRQWGDGGKMVERFLNSAQRGRNGLRWRALIALFIVLATVGIGSTPASGASYSPSLLRYPYTSEVVGSSATLNWGTDRSQSTGSATWGVVSNGSCAPSNIVTATRVAITVGSTSEYQWSARLAFPGAGTYCYRTQLGTTDLLGSDPSPQVKTA